MDVSRVFITTSDEVRGANVTEDHLPRYLSAYEDGFFGGDKFSCAVWGSWSDLDWKYSVLQPGDGGKLAVVDGSRGTLTFDRKVRDGADGRVDFKKFVQTYIGGDDIRGLLQDAASPAFAVVDHNSAHHVTFALAMKAFRACHVRGSRNAQLLINFDAHTDYGGQLTWEKVSCQNWGNKLVSRLDRPQWLPGYSPVSLYVVIGLKGQQRARSWTSAGASNQYNDNGLQPGAANLDDTILRNLLGANLDSKDVYFTIDRDFMQGSATPYGDGDYDPDEGREMVQQTLSFLKRNGASLVGADITGLPCESKLGDELTSRARFAQMREDIRHFYDLVRGY